MSSVFYRDPASAYPELASASDMYLVDTTGKRYLDMSGGAAVASLGHGNAEVREAITRQLEAFEFGHTAFFTHAPQEVLAAALVARFGTPGARCYFTSGGSEANETALKMAWQYWSALGQPGRKIIISRRHSYHGNTLGALSVSGNEGRRAASASPLLDWPRIAPFYPYRHQQLGESLQAYAERAAAELETAILETGPERVAAFICEPVVGASLGAVEAQAGYLRSIRTICDRHDILLIADEIMCGSGRTGTFFACEADGIRPDIATLAKGIASGYQPLAATVVAPKIWQALSASGFVHGHTYVAHPVACAAGLAVLGIIEREGLLTRSLDMARQFRGLLSERFGEHPKVGEIRGRGLFIGIELVSDRATRTGFAPGLHQPDALRAQAMREGLICYPGGLSTEQGFVPHILLAPPLIVQPSHLEECTDKLARLLTTLV